jgi:homoserine kinase
MNTGIKFTSPASVSFYSLGLKNLSVTIEHPYNEIIARKVPSIKGIEIESFSHSRDDEQNVFDTLIKAGNAFAEKFNIGAGTVFNISNRIPFNSGLGNIEASITALISAINELHKVNQDKKQIYDFVEEIELKLGFGINLASVAANLFGGFMAYDPGTAKRIHKIYHPKGLYFSSFYFNKETINVPETAFSSHQSDNFSTSLTSLINGLIISDLDLINSGLKNNLFLQSHPKMNSHFDDIQRISIKNGAMGLGFVKNQNTIFVIYNNTVIKDLNNEKISSFLKEKKAEFVLFDSEVSLNGIYKS